MMMFFLYTLRNENFSKISFHETGPCHVIHRYKKKTFLMTRVKTLKDIRQSISLNEGVLSGVLRDMYISLTSYVRKITTGDVIIFIFSVICTARHTNTLYLSHERFILSW